MQNAKWKVKDEERKLKDEKWIKKSRYLISVAFGFASRGNRVLRMFHFPSFVLHSAILFP
jgi:hypothetical protein